MFKNSKTMKTSTKMRHKYPNRPRKPLQATATRNVLRLYRTRKFITLYIIVLVTLGLVALSSRNGTQVLSTAPLPASVLDSGHITSREGLSISSATTTTTTSSTTTTTTTTSTSTISSSTADDNWKRGLYTNRTLGRDYDPLLVVYTNNNVDTLKTSVNYSSRLLKTATDEELIFNTCSGTTLRHHCQVKSSQILQDLAFMAHMSMNSVARQSTGVQSLSPQVQQLIALAVYGDADTDFWESLGFLDILLSDVYDIVPDKNR